MNLEVAAADEKIYLDCLHLLVIKNHDLTAKYGHFILVIEN
jgi:hypothetical protein